MAAWGAGTWHDIYFTGCDFDLDELRSLALKENHVFSQSFESSDLFLQIAECAFLMPVEHQS